MLSAAKNSLLVMLLLSAAVQASQRCGAAALHDQVLTAAEFNLGAFLLFRGEVAAIDRQSPPSEGGCCTGAQCVSVQCSAPTVKIPPVSMLYVDYTVNEILWGTVKKPLVPRASHFESSCGSFKPVVHEKVIAFCSTFSGWPDDGPMYCDRPIADTEDNLRKARAWIPEAIARRQRQKISEEEARSHLIHRVNPVYPKTDEARKHRIKGDVVVQIFVSRLGTVQSIRSLSGPPELTQSAINAVSLWRYKPFRTNGRPVKVDTTVTVHF